MYHSILVALAPEHDAVAAASIQAARALVFPTGRLQILTVLEPLPADIAQFLPDDQQEKMVRETEAALRQEFRTQDGAEIDVTVTQGNAAQKILEIAQSGGVGCIIIASHQPGLQDYFLGSTATRVVRHATCAVHVLR